MDCHKRQSMRIMYDKQAKELLCSQLISIIKAILSNGFIEQVSLSLFTSIILRT